jgi:hypothetical protein
LYIINFQERTYSIHYSNDIDEEADESYISIEKDDEIEEFQFDDNLSDKLPDLLILEAEDTEVVYEPFSPETHYILDCEQGKK